MRLLLDCMTIQFRRFGREAAAREFVMFLYECAALLLLHVVRRALLLLVYFVLADGRIFIIFFVGA